MQCANTEALNNYLSGEEQCYHARVEFMESIDQHIETIRDTISEIEKEGKNFEYGNVEYDFTDEIEDIIKELM